MASANVDSSVELWKDVPGYEGIYQVSSLGRVKALAKSFYCGKDFNILKSYPEQLIKLSFYENGYQYVGLTKNGKQRKFKVHRLVALAFIPNPENKPQVDHENTIRSDNRVVNLKWATQVENMDNPKSKLNQASCKLGELNPMKQNRRRFAQIDPKSNVILNEWLGVRETAEKLGFESSGIVRCCNGKAQTAHGFIWRYLD